MGSGLIDKFLTHMRNGADDMAMETLHEINRLGHDVRRHLEQRKLELDKERSVLLVEMDHAAKEMDELQQQIGSHRDSVDGLQREMAVSLELQRLGKDRRSRAKSEAEEAEATLQKAVQQLRANRFFLLIPIIGFMVFAITAQKNVKTIRDSRERTAESNRRREKAECLRKHGKRTQSKCEKDIERLTKEMQRCRENLNDIHGRISGIKQTLWFIHQGLSVCQEVAIHTEYASEKTTCITEDFEALSAQSINTVARSGAFSCAVGYFQMAWLKVCHKSQEDSEYLGDIPASLDRQFLSGTARSLEDNDQSLSKESVGLDATTKLAMAITNFAVLYYVAYYFSPFISFVASWVLVNIWFELLYMLLYPTLAVIKVGVETCLDVITRILETLVETFVNSRLAKPLIFICKLFYQIIYVICNIITLSYCFVGVYYTLQFMWVGLALGYLLARRIQTMSWWSRSNKINVVNFQTAVN